MICGTQVRLRPVQKEDWPIFEAWGKERERLWGPYQRFQLDNLSLLQDAFQSSDLLNRKGSMFLIETIKEQTVVGFVRYSMLSIPDADHPYPEIGFGIPNLQARGQGYGREAVELLVDYIFSGYPMERIAAFTDIENIPSQRLLQKLGFMQEGIIRKSYFRDSQWRDIAFFGILRDEFVNWEQRK